MKSWNGNERSKPNTVTINAIICIFIVRRYVYELMIRHSQYVQGIVAKWNLNILTQNTGLSAGSRFAVFTLRFNLAKRIQNTMNTSKLPAT